ncbi:MAG: rRNA maturation RNase YbeY, partial [Acidimicrobiales bacterium]
GRDGREGRDGRDGRDAELNILFVEEQTIASLNRLHLGRDGPTDVLSFSIEDGLGAAAAQSGVPQSGAGRGAAMAEGTGVDGGPPLLLGDVVICPAVARRNAPDHAGTYEDELALLVVHGILHLFGMDHVERAEAEQMESLEEELLARHHRVTP